jgi:hypothetical protein
MPTPLERRCGTCARFVRVMETVSATGAVRREGQCLLGVWPSPLYETSTCGEWVGRGESKARPPDPAPGCDTSRAPRPPTRRPEGAVPIHVPVTLPEDLLEMDAESFRRVLTEVIRGELGVGDASIAGKWDGGEMVLKPGKEGLQEKRVPVETFFQKIIMIRDRLRVLEQKINGHPKLGADDKLQMQQYITACYGSLTTFNVLFADRDDQFVGQKGED